MGGGGGRLHLQALHAAVLHLRDAELYTQLTMHALSQAQGVAATRELLAEFVVATAHLRLSSEAKVPASVLALLPRTTLPSLLDGTFEESLLPTRCAPLLGFTPVVSPKGDLLFDPPSDAAPLPLPKQSPLRPGLLASPGTSPGPGSPLFSESPPVPPPSGVSRLVQLLFGRDDPEACGPCA